MTSRTCMATFSFPLLTLKTLSPMVTWYPSGVMYFISCWPYFIWEYSK